MKKITVSLCVLVLAFFSVNASYADPVPTEEMITSGGIDRTYLLYVPPGLNENKPAPLVFDFHGLGSDAQKQYGYSRMWTLADKYKFILVTPNGYGNSWNGGQCCYPANGIPPDGSGITPVDDVLFVSDMIDKLTEEYRIDQKRIYAIGFSNGGFLSNRLACELSNRIAAIALVASADVTFPGSCDPSFPVPIIAFHGTADPRIPYNSAIATIFDWVDRNGCSDKTEIYYQEGDVECVAYKACYKNADFVFCTIAGGGHNWPGAVDLIDQYCGGNPDPNMCPVWFAGYTTTDIDASQAIWNFFSKHSLTGSRNQ